MVTKHTDTVKAVEKKITNFISNYARINLVLLPIIARAVVAKWIESQTCNPKVTDLSLRSDRDCRKEE